MTSLFILALAIVLIAALIKKAKTDDRIGALIGGIVGFFVGSGVGLAFGGDAINGAVVFALVGGLIGYVLAANLGLSEYIKIARSKAKAKLEQTSKTGHSCREDEQLKTPNRKKRPIPRQAANQTKRKKIASISKRQSPSLAGLGKFVKFILICSVLIFVVAGWILAHVVLSVDPNVSPETVSFGYFIGTATLFGGLVTLSFVVLSPFALLSKRVRVDIDSKPFVPPLIVFLAPSAVFSLILLGQAALHDVTRSGGLADASRAEASGSRSAVSNSGSERRYNSVNTTQGEGSLRIDFSNTSLAELFDSISSELPFKNGNRYYRSVRLNSEGLVWRVDLSNTEKSAFRNSTWRNNFVAYETDWICTNAMVRAVLKKGFTHTLSFYIDRDQWEMRIKYSESDCM